MVKDPQDLSRRERQIMDVIYAKGSASASEVQESLPDPPGYSAVRALLRILVEKGHLRHSADGPRYIYHPTTTRETARKSALKRVLRTFFNGSAEEAVAALLDPSVADLSPEELNRLSDLIQATRMKGQ